VVPVTNTEASDRWFTGGLEGVLPGAYKIARTMAGARLQHELERLREAGVEADGEVVEPTPLEAIRKIASREEIDEVIVSTLPRRLSRWIAMDLPRRIRRTTSLPVTHIAGPAGPSL
jgi:nucleotide-binding universal stress UspA family protein